MLNNKMDDEKLIELVKKHSVLFDLSHVKYMDPKYKTRIWKQIGEQLNANETQCRNRWVNIRDQFRRHVVKRKKKSGKAATSHKKYKYEDQLQFLLPHFQEKSSTSNITSPSEIDETEQDNELSSNYEEKMVATECKPEIPSKFATSTVLSRPETPHIRTKRKSIDDDSPSSQLMKYILEQNNTTQNKQEHAMDSFITAIGYTLKTFTPYYQHVAKNRIFSIVQELELEQLQNASIQPQASSSQPCSGSEKL